MASNGHVPDRLDRLEGLVEVLFNRHLEFEEEHKRLLTAQVVLTDRMDRLDRRLERLAELQAEGAQRLNVLIAIVNEVIRNRPPSAGA
jgi:predicted transcriptional regulator